MSVSIITREGRKISADSALAVVREMNSRALIREKDAWRYMHSLSRRIRNLTGTTVRTTTPGVFLRDLQHAGFITVEEFADEDGFGEP
jgi:hypothetical protein